MQVPDLAEENLLSLIQETALFLWKEWPRNMEAVLLDLKDGFSLRGECPHCRHDAVFIQVTSVFSQFVKATNSGAMRRLIVGMRCQGCLQCILGIALHVDGVPLFTYEAHYPLGKPDDTVAEEIPDHIRPDFREAFRCFWVNAYNATAEMCRRAVEASCLDLGAPEKDVLEAQIDWLEQQRKITPFLRDVAHKVRLGGNRGAHPGIASPVARAGSAPTATVQSASVVTRDHAKAILKFATEFFHHVYVVPKQLDKYDFSKPKAVKP